MKKKVIWFLCFSTIITIPLLIIGTLIEWLPVPEWAGHLIGGGAGIATGLIWWYLERWLPWYCCFVTSLDDL